MLSENKYHGVCDRHISAILNGEYTLTAFLQSIRDNLVICDEDTIFHIGLVGSHAYGDEQPDSDYDLLVLTLMPLSAYLEPVASRVNLKKHSESWQFGNVKIQATTMDFYHFTLQVASRAYAHFETVFGEPLYTLNNSWQARFIKEIHKEINVWSALPWISHITRTMITYRTKMLRSGSMTQEKFERIGRRYLKIIQWLMEVKLPSREMLLSNEVLSDYSRAALDEFLNLSVQVPIPDKKRMLLRSGIPLALNQPYLDILQWHTGKRLGHNPSLTTHALAAELAAPYEKNSRCIWIV